mmetsp:Transcript_20862/g.62166  ORF Transcript_20862/g.62166 Transcript_20862/m.62166 type:complete len:256 (+) Transcript_20862:346-1113(+)
MPRGAAGAGAVHQRRRAGDSGGRGLRARLGGHTVPARQPRAAEDDRDLAPQGAAIHHRRGHEGWHRAGGAAQVRLSHRPEARGELPGLPEPRPVRVPPLGGAQPLPTRLRKLRHAAPPPARCRRRQGPPHGDAAARHSRPRLGLLRVRRGQRGLGLRPAGAPAASGRRPLPGAWAAGVHGVQPPRACRRAVRHAGPGSSGAQGCMEQVGCGSAGAGAVQVRTLRPRAAAADLEGAAMTGVLERQDLDKRPGQIPP